MRAVAMCLSLLQAPRCRFDTLSSFCESFHSLGRNYKNSSSFKLLATNTQGFEGRYSRRWIRRPISTKTETRRNTQSSEPCSIKHEILEESILTRTKVNINKSETGEFHRVQFCDSQQKIAENKEVASLLTVIVFDIETTGLSRETNRIIEIALRDLAGGKNSTFQTLVNPEQRIQNTDVHGITTHMVNRHDVPRMEELVPLLLQYIKSRQKPGGRVLWVAHNGRTFDVPFLRNEFSRCSFELPQDWIFVDSLSLARELVKSGGLKNSSGTSVKALRAYYKIPLTGSAHRAMSDVNALCSILQRLTFDMNLTILGLVERSFAASDLGSPKKKTP